MAWDMCAALSLPALIWHPRLPSVHSIGTFSAPIARERPCLANRYYDMQSRGVGADVVTYNSLIALCARTAKPDVPRALSTLREMDALAFPITDITLSALTQSLARANNVGLARSQLAELIGRGIQVRCHTKRRHLCMQ